MGSNEKLDFDLEPLTDPLEAQRVRLMPLKVQQLRQKPTPMLAISLRLIIRSPQTIINPIKTSASSQLMAIRKKLPPSAKIHLTSEPMLVKSNTF